jgi:hypothetical protein
VASAKERRLWWSVAALLVAIYASVYPAQVLLLWLRERGWLGRSVWTLFAAVAVLVTWAIAKGRARGSEWALLAAVGVLYLSIVVRMPIIQERIHFILYGVVAGLAYEALRERWRLGGAAWPAAGVAALLAGAAGWIDEAIQAAMPNRVYDLRDVGFNALAGALAAGTVAARRGLRAAR